MKSNNMKKRFKIKKKHLIAKINLKKKLMLI